MAFFNGCLTAGSDGMVSSCSPDGVQGAVLEDDGDTGHLYAIIAGPPPRVLCGIRMYSVGDVVLPGRKLSVGFDWSADGRVCAVSLDGDDVAVLDFTNKWAATCLGGQASGDVWTTAVWMGEDAIRARALARRRNAG